MTVLVLPVPDAISTFGGWIASTFSSLGGIGLSVLAVAGDKIGIYGSATGTGDPLASPPDPGSRLLGTIEVLDIDGGKVIVGNAIQTWMVLPFVSAVRIGGTSTGLAAELVGFSGGTVVIVGPVTVDQGRSNHDPNDAWSVELADTSGAFIDPATEGTVAAIQTITQNTLTLLGNVIAPTGAAATPDLLQVGGYGVNATGMQPAATFPTGAAQSYGSTGAYYSLGDLVHGWDPTLGVASAVAIEAQNLGSAKRYALSTALTGVPKGTSAAASATVTILDADHNCLDVAIRASDTIAVAAPGGGALALDASVLTVNTNLLAMSGKLPASLGAKPSGASLSVCPATDAVFTVIGSLTVSGTVTAQQGGAWSVSLAAPIPVGSNSIGTVGLDAGSNTIGAVTAPGAAALALDASILAMSAKLPAALGAQTSANSLSVTPASNALFVLGTGSSTIGAVTGPAAAPLALDSNITSLRAQFPTSLGLQGASTSLGVSLALPSLLVSQDSLAAAGVSSGGSGSHVITALNGENTTAGTGVLMFFGGGIIAQPANGTVATFQSASIASASPLNTTGLSWPITEAFWTAWSTTPGLYTAVAASTGFVRVIGN